MVSKMQEGDGGQVSFNVLSLRSLRGIVVRIQQLVEIQSWSSEEKSGLEKEIVFESLVVIVREKI